jgi:hypothetical protein
MIRDLILARKYLNNDGKSSNDDAQGRSFQVSGMQSISCHQQDPTRTATIIQGMQQ